MPQGGKIGRSMARSQGAFVTPIITNNPVFQVKLLDVDDKMEQPAGDQKPMEDEIKRGEAVIGMALGSDNKKKHKGLVQNIVKDPKGNVTSYIITDEDGDQIKLDPTSVGRLDLHDEGKEKHAGDDFQVAEQKTRALNFDVWLTESESVKNKKDLIDDSSINEAHLGDKLYPDNADEADGKAITKLLEPYKKKWVNASSMMDNRDFDAALREYIMDFEPEAIKNKKDLVEDFKDYLSAMGYSDTLSLEEAKKEYFQTMSPEEFAKIKKGNTVQYMGTTMKVISNDGYVLDLKDNRGQNYKANLGQFIHGGRIAESINESFSIDPDKQAEFIKKAWYDGLHAGRTTTGRHSLKKWEKFARDHRINESVNEAKKYEEVEWIAPTKTFDYFGTKMTIKKGEKGLLISYESDEQYLVEFQDMRFYAMDGHQVKKTGNSMTESVNEGNVSHAEMKQIEKNAERFEMKDGTIIYAIEVGISGMAGEPVSYLKFYSEKGEDMRTADFVKLLKPKDKKELNRWMKDLGDDNEHNARSWAK